MRKPSPALCIANLVSCRALYISFGLLEKWRLILELRKLVFRKVENLPQVKLLLSAGILAQFCFFSKSICVAVVLWELRTEEGDKSLIIVYTFHSPLSLHSTNLSETLLHSSPGPQSKQDETAKDLCTDLQSLCSFQIRIQFYFLLLLWQIINLVA